MRCSLRWGFCASLLLSISAFAQWTTQTIDLQTGWNAVHLTVQPIPTSCDLVFEGLAVERVCHWSRVDGGAEFISDVSEELPRQQDWLAWRPASDPESSLNTFSHLLAGESYLVKMAAPGTLQLKGRAVIVHPEWIPNEYNLTGLPVGSGSSVSFADFFAHTPDIGVDFSDGGEIYEVLSDGSEFQVYRPSLANIDRDKAYWVKAGQVQDYDGPLTVSLGSGGGYIDFGSRIFPRRLHIRNETDSSRTVTLELLPGEAPPQSDGINIYPEAQGKVPLSMVRLNPETLLNEYVPMSGTLSTNIEPLSTLDVTLMPRINEMQSAESNAVWESILKVSDSTGAIEQCIGVSCLQEDKAFSDPAGLWVGDVAVDAVSRAPSRLGGTNVWDTITPSPVSRAYTFRVLLHVSESGECRLLQRAFPVWLPAEEEDAEPEAFVFTDAEYARQFHVDHPEAEAVRISSANFPPMDPVLLSGSFGGSNQLSGSVSLPFNDSSNPFVHPFHPQHDNKEYRNGEAFPLGADKESFDVSRNLRFSFRETDPLNPANPDWQVSEQGGDFEETVSGLNKDIYVKGAFRLKKVSDCGVLSYLAQ